MDDRTMRHVFLLLVCGALLSTACGSDGGKAACTPEVDTQCSDGTTRWVDACGRIGAVAETCDCGCAADGKVCGVCGCTPDCAGKCCGDDGCGGTCADGCAATGQVCGLDTCLCEGTCIPRDCQAQNVECGPAQDGCGAAIECGPCSGGLACEAGTCTDHPCEAKDCEAQNVECGPAQDGCGAVIECGPCNGGLACEAGKCTDHPCEAKDCATLGVDCGPVDDGCGKTIGCGGCPDKYDCQAGKCSPIPCVPKDCAALDVACDWTDDGCGTSIDCGLCATDERCDAGKCVPLCLEGLTPCGGTCADTTSDPRHCGGCDKPCDEGAPCVDSKCQPVVTNCGVTPCTGFTYCDLVSGKCLAGCQKDAQCPTSEHCDLASHACLCDAGYHRCGAACLSDTAIASCGSRCDPCPGSPHGSATCTDGKCGLTCSSDALLCGDGCAPCPAPIHGTTACSAGACVLDCDPGYAWCNGACAVDLPDAAFEDANCDGIDGDAAVGFFVAPTGVDTAPGTLAKPVRTIAKGIALAVASSRPRKEVYIATGTYAESVVLANGVGLYGGYDAANGWKRAVGNVSRIQGGPAAVSGEGLTSTVVLDLLAISAAAATEPGASSYGVRLYNVASARILRSSISAGAGAAGKAAIRAEAARDGTDAPPVGKCATYGTNQDYNVCDGGEPGEPEFCFDEGSMLYSGGGGHGGRGESFMWEKTPGEAGGDGGEAKGGAGGIAGKNCYPDKVGQPGAAGQAGAAGSHASALQQQFGDVTSGRYVPVSGLPGSHGWRGGGGGGGGGAEQECNDSHSGGAGGGGGGSGGCGGLGSPGGDGGGGSFGILASGTKLELTACVVTSAAGGAGGAGALGGAGGAGGAGAASGPSDYGPYGGKGGNGGKGGIGGGGGGGHGGPSYAIVRKGGSFTGSENEYLHAAGGSGGSGGGAAPDGPAGVSGDVCDDPASCGSAPPPACVPPCGEGEYCGPAGTCLQVGSGLVLSEVLVDAVGTDGGREWVEVCNRGSEPIDLGPYSIGNGGSDYTYSLVQLAGWVAAGDCFVVGGPDSDSGSGNPSYDQVYNFTPDFQNGGTPADGVALFPVPAASVTALTVPMDAVVYGIGNTTLLDPSGTLATPAVDACPAGSSIERTASGWHVQSTPTPGTAAF